MVLCFQVAGNVRHSVLRHSKKEFAVDVFARLPSQYHVLPLVDRCKIRRRRVKFPRSHVQLLRSRAYVHLLLFGSLWTIHKKILMVEEVFDHNSNGTVSVCFDHGGQRPEGGMQFPHVDAVFLQHVHVLLPDPVF